MTNIFRVLLDRNKQGLLSHITPCTEPSVCDVNPFGNIQTIAHKAYIPGIYNTWYTQSWGEKVTYRKYWHGCSLCSKYVQYTPFSRMPALAKGQLISKCLFGVFKSPNKQTKTIQLEIP